jgi:hypothetical protein
LIDRMRRGTGDRANIQRPRSHNVAGWPGQGTFGV